MVLGRLAESSDAVLMDLRGFTKEARGCIYEINELLNTVPLERIVFVIDRTTDEIGLVRVLFDGWARLGAASPNRADLTPHVRLVRFAGLYGGHTGNLVALLAATASVDTMSHRMRLWATLLDWMKLRSAASSYWTKIRRPGARFSDRGPSSLCRSCRACITAMRGYDFREAQAYSPARSLADCITNTSGSNLR